MTEKSESFIVCRISLAAGSVQLLHKIVQYFLTEKYVLCHHRRSRKRTLVKVGFFWENTTKIQREFFSVLTYPIIHTCSTILLLVIVIIIITLDRKNVVQRRRSS